MRVAPALAMLLIAFPAVALAGATDAANWLKSNQNPGGSWGEIWFSAGKPTAEARDTTAVIQSLVSANASNGVEFTSGTSWLSSEEPRSTDALARRVRALGDAGMSVAVDITQLLADREPLQGAIFDPSHTGGGWGTASGYSSDAIDTSLALQALDSRDLVGGLERRSLSVAAGMPTYLSFDVPATATRVRLTIVTLSGQIEIRLKEGAQPLLSDPAFALSAGGIYIDYPDAGVPFTPGENWIRIDSSAGANVWLIASWQNPTIDTMSIAEAIDFLMSCQNVDGGFGLEPGRVSTFHATAVATRVLARLAGPYETANSLASAVAYLDARQLPSGLAGHDAGSPTIAETALAKLAFADAGAASQELLGHSALLASQGALGDWSGDAYTTAIALEAITTVPEPGQPLSLIVGICGLTLLARSRRR